MFCSNCGKKLPDNTKFCDDCGHPSQFQELAEYKHIKETDTWLCIVIILVMIIILSAAWYFFNYHSDSFVHIKI